MSLFRLAPGAPRRVGEAVSAPVTPAELRAAAEQFGDPRSAANVLIPPAAAGLLLAAADALEAAERRVAELETVVAELSKTRRWYRL